MRPLFIFLVLATTYFWGYGQDPQLFEKDWYLHELVIDGESHLPPSNDEVEYIPLNFYSDQFSDRFNTIICEGLVGDNISVSEIDIFVEGFLILLDEPCDLTENNEYESLYYNDFFNWQEANKTFDYEITETNGSLQLTLTNETGDTAVYGNQPLATPEIEKLQVSIYPNPAQDMVSIYGSTNQIKKLTLFNSLGKKVKTYAGHQTAINLNGIQSGLYFLEVVTAEGSVTKKLIKK